MPTVVFALDARTDTDGIAARPVTDIAVSDPLLVTPVMPDINEPSTLVAVTALTDRFSIPEVVTPAPYAAVAEVFERDRVSSPAPPVKLSPAFRVATVAPETVDDVALNVSAPSPPVRISKPVVRALTEPAAAAGAVAVSTAALPVVTVVASEVTVAGIAHSPSASLVIVW